MPERRSTGTQSIERTMLLLKRLAVRGRTGWGITDLALRCDLDKGTVHRILAALVRARMVERDPLSHRYRTGPMLFELSLARPDSLAIQRACEGPLARLAQKLNCLTYVYLRSDDDVVVSAHAGKIPIKAMMIEIGTRRPMVQTAGGVAMLLALPRVEADAIVVRSLHALAQESGPARVKSVRSILEQSRRCGYGISEGHIAPDTTAIAVAILDAGHQPMAAINVGGPSDYFPPDSRQGVVALLREEAQIIEQAVARITQQTQQ